MKKTTKALAALLLAALMTLSACTSPDSGEADAGKDDAASTEQQADGEKDATEEEKDGEASTEDTASTEEGSKVGDELMAVNAKYTSELAENGELRLSISDMVKNWNSSHIDGNTVDQNNIVAHMGVTNWDFAGDGSYTPNTNFLKSYEVVEGPPQVVKLTLNENAKWNTGNPITWEDYEANWQACKGTEEAEEEAEAEEGEEEKAEGEEEKAEGEEKAEEGEEKAEGDKAEGEEAEEEKEAVFQCASTDGWNQVASVEKGENEFEVVVTYKSSLPDWSAHLSSVSPKEMVKDADTFNKGWVKYDRNFFTGPFQVADIDAAQKVITLERNPDWWGTKPVLEKITFREVQADQVGNAFVNDEIDSVTPIIDANTLNVVKGRSDVDVRMVPGLQWRHFTFNSKAESIADVKLRQALVRGINRKAIAESDLAGMDLNVDELMTGNHLFMPGQVGYQDNSTDFRFDPERAKKELDDLGWVLEDGKEFRTKDGKQLDIKYLVITGISTSENEGQMLQNQMKEIGVNIIFDPSAPTDFFKKVSNGEFEITTFTWQGTPYPMNNIGQIYGTDSASNFAQLSNPELDKVIAQADTEVNVEKRIELANKADLMVWESVHTLPIYRRMDMNAVPENLANYGATGLGSVRAEYTGFMK